MLSFHVEVRAYGRKDLNDSFNNGSDAGSQPHRLPESQPQIRRSSAGWSPVSLVDASSSDQRENK
ncbi:hypothetical protein [Undibacterium sp. TC9W]|uniref:hypothetical protein n=1 Tax=Undibacterium sp. TC9W TaxID=3413053 RepID=UPI003BF3B8EA